MAGRGLNRAVRDIREAEGGGTGTSRAPDPSEETWHWSLRASWCSTAPSRRNSPSSTRNCWRPRRPTRAPTAWRSWVPGDPAGVPPGHRRDTAELAAPRELLPGPPRLRRRGPGRGRAQDRRARRAAPGDEGRLRPVRGTRILRPGGALLHPALCPADGAQTRLTSVPAALVVGRPDPGGPLDGLRAPAVHRTAHHREDGALDGRGQQDLPQPRSRSSASGASSSCRIAFHVF